MEDITLEKIDIIRERAGVTYARAKEVLEINEGNIVDSLIYIESNLEDKEKKIYSTLDELIKWLKDIVNKGNVNRIRIKKEDRVLVDVPINAGIAVGVIAAVWKPLIAIGLATATLTTVPSMSIAASFTPSNPRTSLNSTRSCSLPVTMW